MAAMAERGSFLWFMMAITQIWLSLKLMEEVNSAVTTLFGASAAACVILGLVVFRKEQREMILNPLGKMSKEVHQDAIDKQGKGIWFGVILWICALMLGSVII
tara:strand:+ start:116 stop:424 length:309 start_codon:yes stop_codon:yes gene_type:complete